MRHTGELVLHAQLGPADRARLAHAREVVALEVDDHHVLGRVLRVVDVLAGGPRPLDRLRDERPPATGEEELRRGRDDRPALACERPRHERPQRRKRLGERHRIALERRREMLDEVDLVDVAARDRRAHGLDRGRVGLVGPAPLPLAEPEAHRLAWRGSRSGRMRQARTGSGHGSGGVGNGRAPQRRREPVAEVEIGDDVLAPPEALAGEVVLERLERAGRFVQLERQRLRPSVSRYRRRRTDGVALAVGLEQLDEGSCGTPLLAPDRVSAAGRSPAGTRSRRSPTAPRPSPRRSRACRRGTRARSPRRACPRRGPRGPTRSTRGPRAARR